VLFCFNCGARVHSNHTTFSAVHVFTAITQHSVRCTCSQ